MPERHLLLVTYHFPPSAASGSFRLLGFARHLPKFDWRVSVVAPPELPWEPVDRALIDQIPFSTAVRSVAYPRRASKLLRWAAPWGVWLRPAWQECRRLAGTERIDAVLTSGPPHCVHVLGHHLQRKFGIPWIADFRDPWIRAGGRAPRGVTGLWARHWERKILRRADVILANAPNAAAAMERAFPRSACKIETLTNGYDPIPSEIRGAADVRRAPDLIRLVHAGELYAGRDPRPLFDALAEWNRDLTHGKKPMLLDIVGRTSMCGIDLKEAIRLRGIGDFANLRGQVSYRGATEAMLGADVLVLLDGPGRVVGVPAKVYEYLATGRPILALAERSSDTASILERSGAPHCVMPLTNPDSLGPALEKLASAKPQAEFALERGNFTREKLAEQLAGILERCLQPLPARV